MKKLSVVCLSLLALFADGCQKHSLVLVPALAKPALYAKKGDVLEWYKPDGKTDMPVTFSASGGSPCREGIGGRHSVPRHRLAASCRQVTIKIQISSYGAVGFMTSSTFLILAEFVRVTPVSTLTATYPSYHKSI